MRRLARAAALVVCLCSIGPAFAIDVPFWPVVYYKQDPVSGETETSLGGLLYVRHRTADYAASQVLSLPQEYPREYPRQFYLLWPLTGLRTGNGHDAWVFPFLWSGDSGDGRERRFSLFPAFYYGRNGDDHTFNLAVLQHNTWSPRSRGHYLFPLFWYGVDREGPHTTLGVLPLVWLSRSSSSNTWHGGRWESTSAYGGALLLNWWGRHRSHSVEHSGKVVDTTSRHDGVFPVFSRSDCTRQAVTGPTLEDQEDASLWIAPYCQSRHVSMTSNRLTGVVTEFRSNRRRDVIPVYWSWDWSRDQKRRTGRAVLPVWWRSEEFISGELETSASFVVPVGAHFFRKGEYDTYNLAGPIFTRVKNERLQYSRYDVLFPFFSWTAGEAVSGGRVFPLFGWDDVAGQHENAWALFPFGWRLESAGEPYAPAPQRALGLHELGQPPWINPPCRKPPDRYAAVLPFWWSCRKPDEQNEGVLPFYWRNTYRHRETRVETVLPLLLGARESEWRDDRIVFSRQDYLFSILAHGTGKEFRLWRAFPFYSFESRNDRQDVWSCLLPFSYSTWGDPDDPVVRRSSKLSIPFSFLPLYGSRSNTQGAPSEKQESWLFPFYRRSSEQSSGRDIRRLSILWPLWNGEWEGGEAHIRGLGGLSNFYERDANGFVEQRILYRLFTRRNRSWFHEHEFMPFYSRTVREDGSGSWDFLGGLLGAGRDASRRYVRLLYVPIPTGKPPAPGPDEVRAARDRHAGYALNYLKHNRFDRAAIEFTLAGDARANDVDFQLATAEAYLNADPAGIAGELRSSIPAELKSLVGADPSGGSDRMRRVLRNAAITRFEAAMRLGADKPATLVRIARAQCDIAESEKALLILEQSDTLRPSFATAMDRLGVLCWHLARGPQKNRDYTREARLMEDLLQRYPESPTLLLNLARLPAPGEVSRGRFGWIAEWWGSSDVFSARVDHELGLLRRGAVAKPGAEEESWLRAGAKPMRSGDFTPEPAPGGTCARTAISILNARLARHLSDKDVSAAETLLPEIRSLLPRACPGCERGAVATRAAGWQRDASAVRSASSLYAVYVRERKQPLVFIATVKAWAAGLCVHQRKEFENALASVRFEQQYLKDWRITGMINGKAVNQVHRGDFFQRYVDLDALLGKPDRCEVAADCVVVSPDERQAFLRLGFDHRLTVELNGRVLFGPHARKIAVRDEYTVPVTLIKGENRLRLVVADDRLGYGFFARLSAVSGELMEDVVVGPAP